VLRPPWGFRRFFVLVATASILLDFGAPSARSAGTSEPSSTARTSATVSKRPAAELPFGMSFGDTLPGLSPAALTQALDDAVALHATWIRIDFDWGDIQPSSPDRYRWAGIDKVVAAALARNLSILPILAYTPAWARPAGCSSAKCAPADPATFAAFAGTAARRFAPLGVHTWELWNEPNVAGFWLPAPDAAQYAKLAKLTTAALRKADPKATVVSGGLAPAATGKGEISPTDFLAGVCKNGGLKGVDGIGFHPYSFPVPPGYTAPWNAWSQMAQTKVSLLSVLAGCGAGNKRIWITEYGAPTNGPGTGATPSNYRLGSKPDHVDEALQEVMATDSVRLARGAPYVGGLFWYSGRDRGTRPVDIENFFGLRRFDGTPKPAFDALRRAASARP
jgi:polysaccharide biosynthesis protein PslG